MVKLITAEYKFHITRGVISFLNAASENVDAYNAYLRDGLRPWSKHMKRVHSMLEKIHGIEHGLWSAQTELHF